MVFLADRLDVHPEADTIIVSGEFAWEHYERVPSNRTFSIVKNAARATPFGFYRGKRIHNRIAIILNEPRTVELPTDTADGSGRFWTMRSTTRARR